MMDAPFNSLKRIRRYTFVFGNGVPSIEGVLHEILPDGTLLVAGREWGTSQVHETIAINPANVVYVREES